MGSATITTFYLMGLPSTAYPLHNWLPYDLTFSINYLLMILPSLCFFRAQPIMPKRDTEYYLWRRNKEKEKKEEKEEKRMVCRDRNALCQDICYGFADLSCA